MEDLSTIIEDSLTDATLPTPEVDLDITPEPIDTAPEPTEPTPEPSSIEVPNPAVKAEQDAKSVEDDFDKKFGLTPNAASGRENRIPYSRVKKITEKAVNDAKSSWQKEFEAAHVPSTKYGELEAKVKDYDTKFAQVAEFEKVMVNEPVRFLQMLNGMPAYAQLFQQLQQPQQATPQVQTQVPEAPVPDDFPQPDVNLPDGTSFYSMEGVKTLTNWIRSQAKKETLAEVDNRIKAVESRYAPLERDYNQYQQVQTVLPQVQKQIAEARQWPLFNDNEDEIVKALADNPAFSLERAYQHVVVPKMRAEQDRLANEAKVSKESIRAEVLKELKTAPRSTATSTGQTRPVAPSSGSARSIEDVIADSIKGLK